jgi:phage head maturation protease
MTKHTFIQEARIHINEAKSTRDTGVIEAVVTTYGKRDAENGKSADGRKFWNEEGAFSEWMAEFMEAGKPLPMYVNHQSSNLPIGEWTEFRNEGEAMVGVGKVYTNTTMGRDTYEIMKNSPLMLNSVSVSMYANEALFVDDDGEEVNMEGDIDYENVYFRISKGGLSEVSIVQQPNNPSAEIMRLECIHPDGGIHLPNLEQILRESGVSRAQATIASAVFKKVWEQRESVLGKIKDKTGNQGELDKQVAEAEALKALELYQINRALDLRLQRNKHV